MHPGLHREYWGEFRTCLSVTEAEAQQVFLNVVDDILKAQKLEQEQSVNRNNLPNRSLHNHDYKLFKVTDGNSVVCGNPDCSNSTDKKGVEGLLLRCDCDAKHLGHGGSGWETMDDVVYPTVLCFVCLTDLGYRWKKSQEMYTSTVAKSQYAFDQDLGTLIDILDEKQLARMAGRWPLEPLLPSPDIKNPRIDPSSETQAGDQTLLGVAEKPLPCFPSSSPHIGNPRIDPTSETEPEEQRAGSAEEPFPSLPSPDIRGDRRVRFQIDPVPEPEPKEQMANMSEHPLPLLPSPHAHIRDRRLDPSPQPEVSKAKDGSSLDDLVDKMKRWWIGGRDKAS